MIELSMYLLLVAMSVFFSLRHNLLHKSYNFFLLWIFFYAALVLIVRNNFDADINTYAASMPHNSVSPYYLREPFVWIGQKYLFDFTKNAFWVFVLSDVLVGIVLFKALKNFSLPHYAYFSILIFFPFVLGMQNVYRQWVAVALFLYSFSLFWNESAGPKKYASFMLSVLSHNVAAIFLPLLLVRNTSMSTKLFFHISFMISIAGIIFGASTKSSADTGADLVIGYLIILAIFLVLILLLDRCVIRRVHKVEYKAFWCLLFLAFVSSLMLSSAGAERVSMFCFLVAYPFLVNIFEERFKEKTAARSLISICGFVPLFFFETSKFIVQ